MSWKEQSEKAGLLLLSVRAELKRVQLIDTAKMDEIDAVIGYAQKIQELIQEQIDRMNYGVLWKGIENE